jgi:miniconductance mechanosensitive channel
MTEYWREFLVRLGLQGDALDLTELWASIFGVALLAYLANFIVKRIILRVVALLASRTQTDWDDVLVRRRVFSRLSHLAPAIVISVAAPSVFQQHPAIVVLAHKASDIYMIMVGLLVVSALLAAIGDIYDRFPVARRIPIKGYLQLVMLIVNVVGAIFIVSIVVERSPVVLLTGLGALTAVLLLVFKDTILGLVAGIQLVANDMVRPGDWVEMPKYGADGDVIEITLNTVKIRNWDKTVTTIPTYSLISDSFKNWRGMQESGGRRIKRSVLIDINSIRFCTPDMVERFARIHRIKDYVAQKQGELREHNERNQIDDSVLVNGRRMTNVGTFRAYLVNYLRAHPKVHQEMTFLVRQLAPGERGLPIEIYVFSSDQAWVNYEDIQADIFDHIFAVLPEFGLRPFQNPAGADIASAIERLRIDLAPRN